MTTMKLMAQPESFMTKKALVAAKYAGVDLALSMHPGADFRIAVLETKYGCVFSSVAIARYLARLDRVVGLYGQNVYDGGAIDSWVEFCTLDLEVALSMLVLPAAGACAEVPAATAVAKEDVRKALTVLDRHLLCNTFMVGHQVTLADICVACALLDGMKTVFDPALRASFPNLMRWFKLCISQEEFASVFGTVTFFGGDGGKASAKASPKKQSAPASPKKVPAPAPAAAGGNDDVAAKTKAVSDEIRALKEKLKSEGIPAKKINEHEEVKRLVAQLQELKQQGPAAAPPQADGGAPKEEEKKAAAAAGGNDDVAAKTKAVSDEIRALKEKLKSEGIPAKKINEHEEVKRLVAQLQELKQQGPAAAPPQADGGTPKEEEKNEKGKKAAEKPVPKEKGKKDKAKKAEEQPAPKDEPKEPTVEELAEERKKKMKAVVKEGGKRGVEIEGAADMGGLQFFCTSVDEPEGDIEMLTACMNAMNAECKPDEEERKGGSGNIGKMIFSAGVDQLAVIAYLPKHLQDKLDAKEWLDKVLSLNGGELVEGSTSACATGIIKADSNSGKFPLKMKEPSIQEAINFLKSKGLFPDCDSDDDEIVFGDDDFPS